MHLTLEFTRVRVASQTYLGWGDFIHDLNQFLNLRVRKQDDGLTFVVLREILSPDRAQLHVYLETGESYSHDPAKLLSAVRYFLGEKGLTITAEEKDTDPMFANSVILTVSGLSRYETPDSYAHMENQWMKRALMEGTAIDVRQVGYEVEPGVFRLTEFVPEVEYVDSQEEAFIQSIKRDRQTGEILAATDTRFFTNNDDEDDETLYLR